MTIFEDSTAVATVEHGDWVFFYWKTHLRGRLPVSLVKAMKRIERYIKANGLKGWLANSEKEHTAFHSILRKVGAEPYAEEGGLYFFKKEFPHV